MQYLANNHLSSVIFSQDDIVKIIENLDSSQAHGHDNITITRMSKIFEQCVDIQVFSHLSGKRVILFLSIKR